MIREPLVHFLLIGAGLFLLFGWRGNPASLPGGASGPESKRLVVTQGDIDQLIARFEKTWQRPPSEAEIKGLVERFVRDEIYYREALAIGLDRDDAVVRQRMRLKMEFIFEDVSAQVEPTDEDLEAFMKEHPDKYRLDPQVAFRQVYINADGQGGNAETEARRILAQLEGGADPGSVGDPLLLEHDGRLLPLWDIEKQFGKTFSRGLLELEPGRWEGPVRSGYGLHLVFIEERVEEKMPALNEVREMVKRDWAVKQKQEFKDAAYAKLRERYTVEFESPQTTATSSVATADAGATIR
jgi:hypothetical protein